MSRADENDDDDGDDDDDEDDEDEKKDRFLEAAEEVISSMKQTGQKATLGPATSNPPFRGEEVEVKPLSDPSHKLSDHLITSNSETVSSPSDPSHSLEDHIADEIVSKENDPNIQKDMSDLILPDVIVDPVPGRVSWIKPKKRRKHVHRGTKRSSNKEEPFGNGWKHTQAEHDSGSEEDKLFHQFEEMYDGDGEMLGDDEVVL